MQTLRCGDKAAATNDFQESASKFNIHGLFRRGMWSRIVERVCLQQRNILKRYPDSVRRVVIYLVQRLSDG